MSSKDPISFSASTLTVLKKKSLSLLFSSFVFDEKKDKYNKSNDNDFFLSTVSVEAEKEIGSFDDIILVLVALFYIFG
jgi:hypothetical protein